MEVFKHVGDKPHIDSIEEGSLAYNIKDDTLYTRHRTEVIPIKENAWAAKSGPKAYVSGSVITWSHSKESLPNSKYYFDCSDNRGITILQDGQYNVVYRHRTNVNNEDIWGTLSGNLSRTYLEHNDRGVFFHDHAFGTSSSYISTYTGFLQAGDLISAGPGSAYKDKVYYGTEDYKANLTIIKL